MDELEEAAQISTLEIESDSLPSGSVLLDTGS